MIDFNHKTRKPDPLPDPEDLPKEAQEALKALMELPAGEAAELVRLALESETVRETFLEKFVTVAAGVGIGDRGKMALYLSRYYNAPVACLMAITRHDPETGERQLLVGERPWGDKTIIGGHFSPFTAQECWDYFFERGFSVEELHHYFQSMTPPATPEEDATTKDINLLATVAKEMIQECNIFLMPKELTDTEKADLHKRVEKAFGDKVAISYDYDIVDHNTLWSAVGNAGKGWHSLIIGYGVVLHDQQALNQPTPGDDIAKTYWVPESRLSSLSSEAARQAGKYDPQAVYLGDMKYGEKPIVEEAWAAMNRDIRKPVHDENGNVNLQATTDEMTSNFRRLCAKFNLQDEEILRQSDSVVGKDASANNHMAGRFARMHHECIITPQGKGEFARLENLFKAEKQLLKSFVEQEGLPKELAEKIEKTTLADYEQRLLEQLSDGISSSHAERLQQTRGGAQGRSR